MELKDEIVREDLYLDDEKVYEGQKPIEKPVVFFEEKPKWDKLQDHQEAAMHIELPQYKDVSFRAEDLVSEQDLQSIVSNQVEAKSEFVADTESLPDRFSEYSLLSVEEKVKRYQMTGNNYNLNLYKEVMRKMNQNMSSSELFEGYQEIYEVKMMNRESGMQEKKWDRNR